MREVPLHQGGRYGVVAIALHWGLAVAIVGSFGLGVYMHDLPFSMQRLKLYNWHKWAGVLILSLSVVRLIWRIACRPPALPAHIAGAMRRWQARAYGATHVIMYLLFFAVPLTGWAYTSAAGFPVVLFGVLPLPDFMPRSQDLAEAIKPAHAWCAYALAAAVVVHVTAALKHHFLDGDGLLNRMWPASFTKSSSLTKSTS